MGMRKIIKIDEDLCDGCGECVPSCEEGALKIIDGKAKLVKDIYCDGLGACLGECPQGALTIEEREAAEFDEKAVDEFLQTEKSAPKSPSPLLATGVPHGCPGSALRTMAAPVAPAASSVPGPQLSSLTHWPVQLMLVPPQAPFLAESDLLICADCVPFTVPDFHSRFLTGRSVVVACPKLDNLDLYREKLKEMFAVARPTSITVLRMEVPCCGGIVDAVLKARDASLPHMPVVIHTMDIRGGDRREVAQPAQDNKAQGAS